MKCDKCGARLVFVNTDSDNGLIGYWICLKCKTDKEE